MKPYLVIDIETEPLPIQKLQECMPEFEAPGNIKDPEKIKSAIEQKRQDWIDDSALHAERCRILCAGVWYSGLDEPDIIEGEEKIIITHLLGHIINAWGTMKILVGHYIYGFDLPVIIRRDWATGGKPFSLLVNSLRNYYPPENIFDTALAWKLSNRDEKISLKTLAWHLGVGTKEGDGADFAKLYHSDRPKALEYLKNDLLLTRKCYERMV